MIIALQMLILFRESVLAVLNGWLPPFFRQLVRKLSDNGLVPVEDEIEDQVYSDYDEECGVVFFPPVHAQRYAAVCDCLMDERWFGKLEKVLNIGKHYDVNFMKYLTEVSGITQILGLDIASSLNCTCDMLDISFGDYQGFDKPLQITLLQGNAADPDYRLIGCDAVIGIELIQKLLPHDLDRIVHNIFGFIKPRVALFTTPNADFNCLMKGLYKNGLRQSDHYFEWTREQLHDWCSNIVGRYPDYTVMSRGVCPGPPGTSHYGCFSQLVLFISEHYKKEMELNVNSLVAVSSLPEPEQVSEIGWITPTSMPSSHSMLQKLLEDESSELHYSESSSEGALSILEHSLRAVQNRDKNIQCNIEVEFGKSFVMFNEEEMYEVRMPRKPADKHVYEIGDVANRLNNTMYDVKNFSKPTQYLMEKNEANSQDLMDEILKLTEKLTSKMNRCAREESHMWNNVNWGENVPYWNQYYKVVGVYNYPYEGKSEEDQLLDLLSEEINKVFDAQTPGNQLGIPLAMLMNAVKHITTDVERVITLMEDSGYELEGDSVVYTGVDVSDASHEDKFDTKSDFGSISNESTGGQDVNGRSINRTLFRKVRMLRLMLQHDEEVKQALGQVVCRLKKIAMSSARDKQGAARTKWLQSKLLDILTLTEKSILRRKLRNIENDPLKGLGYDENDETATHLTKIKADVDTTMKIVEKYETILRMSADNSDDSERETEKSFTAKFADSSRNGSSVDLTKLDNEKDCFEVLAPETDNLSYSLNDEMTRYTLDDHQIDSDVQDWEEKDMSIYKEESIKTKVTKCDDVIKPIQANQMTSRKELKVKTNTNTISTKKKKSNSSNSSISSICKKKSKNSVNLITVKRSLKYSTSYKIRDRRVESPPKQEKSYKKVTYNNTLNCIEKIKQKMGPTLVLSIPAKPIPESIFQLCHPELHQKTAEPVQKINDLWYEGMNSPVAATEHGQKIDILSHSETLTIALQRMIGTDPDVNAEIFEHELELLDRTSLLTETSSCLIPRTGPGSPGEREPSKATPAEELNAQPDSKSFAPTIAVTVKTPVVEILTQDGTELIALQRTIGTDPVCIEMCERELMTSKLASSAQDTDTLEKVVPSDGHVSSQEFFLYDINEPTTSKGLRHIGMDVQCGTDGQVSATTSVSFPLRKLVAGIKLENSFTDIRDGLKTDCVTSTNDILKPCGRMSPPWMKCVGIKIKDSLHQIEEPTGKDTKTAGLTVTNDNLLSKNTVTGETLKKPAPNQQIWISDSLERHTKKNISDLRPIANNIKRSVQSCPPKSGGDLRLKESNLRKPEPTGGVTRFLHVPKGVRSKLSCGGVHVHSYKDLHVSEDVMYQGEWQRHRQKSLRKNLVYGNLKKPNKPSADKLKLNHKINASNKSQKATIEQPKTVITTPIIIRNTKASKMKEAVTKINLQKKLEKAATKPEINKIKSATLPKVTSKSTVSYSKSVKEKSNKLIQPHRQTRFAQQPTIIKENKVPSAHRRNVNIPSYMHNMFKKQQDPKVPSKLGMKTDSLSNLLSLNNEQITSEISQSKIEDLLSALLKVSIEPSKNIKFIVYRKKRDISQCSTVIQRIPVPGRLSKENILRRQPSQCSQVGSVYSATNSATVIINPVVTITKLFQPKRKTMSIKSSVTCKSSESKMLSRIKKIARLFSKKSPTNFSENERVPGTSNSPISTKHDSSVDLSSDDTDYLASREASNDPSFIQSYVNSSDSEVVSISNIENKEYIVHTQDSETMSTNETESIVRESVTTLSDRTEVLSRRSPTELHKTISDDTNDTFDAMKQLVEKCLCCMDTPDLIANTVAETAHLICPNTGNIPSVESGTYETGSSFHRTNDGGSLASVTRSFSDFSGKLQPSTSKLSGCLADYESWSNVVPSHVDSNMVPCGSKETVSLTQKPMAGQAFSSFSVDAEPSPLTSRQLPDYVNLVDSETGSCANAPRRATSEEVLISGRSSSSYASCVLDEEAAIPSWLYNISQQASGSFASIPHPIAEEVPDLEYDVNGNELTVHGAGAGDGYGIHSDQSQDSSGQGSSFSSSTTTSGAPSETIVVDATFMAEHYEPGERPNTSEAPLIREESSDSPVTAAENSNTPRPLNRNRISRIAHRVSLPASDADISSIGTDVASDN